MPDPHSPRWHPQYTGDDSFGDVGSGEGFGADLYQLYRAGRSLLPDVAERFSDLTGQVHRLAGPTRHVFEYDNYLEPAHSLLLKLRGDLHGALRASAMNIAEAGRALVDIADSYVATDEAAVESLTRLLEKDQDDYRRPTPPIRDLPMRNAPSPPPQPDDGHLA